MQKQIFKSKNVVKNLQKTARVRNFSGFAGLRTQYERDGYVVIPQLLAVEERKEIMAEMVEICRGSKGEVKGVTTDLDSSDDEVLSRYLCIHFPHKISDLVMNLASKHKRTTEVLTELIGPNVKMVQTMMFVKNSGYPGQNWHQDEFYIPTRDRSLTASWLALDHAYVQSGCLWVVPGSHRRGVIYPVKEHGDPENFDMTPVAYDFPDSDKAVSVELHPGDAVFFNGYLLHRSLKNNSNHMRRAFANHYMSAESLLPWDYDGRLPPSVKDARDIVMVAGEDPYAWKGIDEYESTRPFVRGDYSYSETIETQKF